MDGPAVASSVPICSPISFRSASRLAAARARVGTRRRSGGFGAGISFFLLLFAFRFWFWFLSFGFLSFGACLWPGRGNSRRDRRERSVEGAGCSWRGWERRPLLSLGMGSSGRGGRGMEEPGRGKGKKARRGVVLRIVYGVCGIVYLYECMYETWQVRVVGFCD